MRIQLFCAHEINFSYEFLTYKYVQAIVMLTTSTDCKAYFMLYLEQAYSDSVDLHRASSSPSIVVIIIYGAGRKNLTNVKFR